MSTYNTIMDFIFDETIKMLAGVTNAPVATVVTEGEPGKEITKTTCSKVIPMNVPFGTVGLKNAHDDVVFFNVTFVDDRYNRQFNATLVANADGTKTTTSFEHTRAIQVFWACCGTDCYEWADKIRTMLIDSEIRNDFAAQSISLIPDIPAPIFAPEVLGQEWLHRYDISARFYQKVTTTKVIPAVSIASVDILTKEGVEATCSASEAS